MTDQTPVALPGSQRTPYQDARLIGPIADDERFDVTVRGATVRADRRRDIPRADGIARGTDLCHPARRTPIATARRKSTSIGSRRSPRATDWS